MKLYTVLTTFRGSQTGNDGPFTFTKGEEVRLSDHLAELALKEKWVTPALEKPKPESRETKIDTPEETKPEKPAAKKTAAKKGKK